MMKTASRWLERFFTKQQKFLITTLFILRNQQPNMRIVSIIVWNQNLRQKITLSVNRMAKQYSRINSSRRMNLTNRNASFYLIRNRFNILPTEKNRTRDG